MPSKQVHRTGQAHRPKKGWPADNIVDWPRTSGMYSPRRGDLEPPTELSRSGVDHSVGGGGPNRPGRARLVQLTAEVTKPPTRSTPWTLLHHALPHPSPVATYACSHQPILAECSHVSKSSSIGSSAAPRWQFWIWQVDRGTSRSSAGSWKMPLRKAHHSQFLYSSCVQTHHHPGTPGLQDHQPPQA
jgi:hypothetical protein